MSVTCSLFEAYLKCSTKCWLLSRDESGTGNDYADWTKTKTEAYRSNGIKRLTEEVAHHECIVAPSSTENLKTTRWRLVVDFAVRAQNLESRIHGVEHVPPEDRGKPAQFIPIRFVASNKLTKNDKLLLAYDALALSESFGQEVAMGKIMHGDDWAALKVKTSALESEVRKLIDKISMLLSNDSPPELVLNRHCAECEFKAQCKQKAIESDDLSLLAAMTEKERGAYRSKGIFTVSQLSYTFRPRRTPKRAKKPASPRYFALQALAIRENTVYVHGRPELPESKTKVYLDIEGLPDSNLYYLIGALVVADGGETLHSFWADGRSEETAIFTQLAEVVSGLTDFRVFHYGDYESTALKRIQTRQPDNIRSMIGIILSHSTNVLSLVYPHIYFPTYSNSLKQIGEFLGYRRQNPDATGLESVMWRKTWETDRSDATKSALLCYNKDDCLALNTFVTLSLS